MAREVRVELAERRCDLGERNAEGLHALMLRPWARRRADCRADSAPIAAPIRDRLSAGIPAGPGYPASVAVELVYETHAITTDNEAGIATGWLPGVLSERGLESAAELGARRRDDGIAAVYVSDLARAVDTARIAFEGTGIPIHRDARLRECNYGRQNGIRAEDHAPQRILHVDEPWPDGESYRQVVDRTRSLLDDLARHWNGRRLVLIAHSANRWALEHLLQGRDLDELVAAGFTWQPGWDFVIPSGWGGRSPST